MKIVRGSQNWEGEDRPPALVMGNFDGVHLGHQVILKELTAAADDAGWLPVVYTFDPHPAKILAPKSAPPLLQTTEQKIAALEKLGMEAVILEKFDPHFSRWSPESFFNEIILTRLTAVAVAVGYDFTFGHKRSGNVEVLKKLCNKHHLKLHVTDAQFQEATLVSSTQIRNLVAQGNVTFARKLLGRPFALIGNVIPGHGIGGSQLGIHTANLAVENELFPKTGIYVTETRILKTAEYWPSATSVGFNPTFPSKEFSVESHLIGFKGELKGEKIEVEFLSWLREELTFPNAESLADQIKKDIQAAKTFHETLRHHR